MKNWDMSEEGFSRLLVRLNADPALAGEQYENLRARLIYYFERNNCRNPAELADETINRVARKLEEGAEIKDVFNFSSGVARYVLFEHWKDPFRKWVELNEQLPSPEVVEREFDARRLECKKKCLQNLAPKEQELMIKNCTTKKNGREDLAKTMDLTINAFRVRIFRIRGKLQKCYKNCISDREHKDNPL
jgi:DNA-directed RNA polymerase specialized sigma24 family protein